MWELHEAQGASVGCVEDWKHNVNIRVTYLYPTSSESEETNEMTHPWDSISLRANQVTY